MNFKSILARFKKPKPVTEEKIIGLYQMEIKRLLLETSANPWKFPDLCSSASGLWILFILKREPTLDFQQLEIFTQWLIGVPGNADVKIGLVGYLADKFYDLKNYLAPQIKN